MLPGSGIVGSIRGEFKQVKKQQDEPYLQPILSMYICLHAVDFNDKCRNIPDMDPMGKWLYNLKNIRVDPKRMTLD